MLLRCRDLQVAEAFAGILFQLAIVLQMLLRFLGELLALDAFADCC